MTMAAFLAAGMERPAVKRLIADVKQGLIDIVVVYKVDRLTRALADFGKIVEILDANNASFVSITQQFNTTTSMGRLTLNMLLSFAQFEREVTSERIRDKLAASRRRGLWMGGTTPIGYLVKNRSLAIHMSDAKIVRFIFRRFLLSPNASWHERCAENFDQKEFIDLARRLNAARWSEGVHSREERSITFLAIKFTLAS